jgi:hypothetical protein
MKERFKAIIELVAIAAAVFALARELVAELEKLDPTRSNKRLSPSAKVR